MLALAIFLLCVLPSLTALELSIQDCTLNRLPSLYEQYCCVKGNHGKPFIFSDQKQKQYIFCPPAETPASCSSVNVFTSCSAILTYRPTATSGYYNIMLANGTVITVYCDMEGVSCDGEGGWMRVGHLNMSDPSELCPPGFRLYEENGIRACGRQSSGCQSVEFLSRNINYTQVCGRVTGYQKGSTSAIDRRHNDINGTYVDGVSITRGTMRDHIWTFMVGFKKNYLDLSFHSLSWLCPCSPNSTVDVQSFIGNDYFCEAGDELETDNAIEQFYTEPLWDGKQCGLIEEACCNVTGIPWFNKVLEQPTTDYIELRVCADENIGNEDAPVGYYELYVK